MINDPVPVPNALFTITLVSATHTVAVPALPPIRPQLLLSMIPTDDPTSVTLVDPVPTPLLRIDPVVTTRAYEYADTSVCTTLLDVAATLSPNDDPALTLMNN